MFNSIIAKTSNRILDVVLVLVSLVVLTEVIFDEFKSCLLIRELKTV